MLNRESHIFSRSLILLTTILYLLHGAATASSQVPAFGIRPQANKGYFEYTLAPGEHVQDVLVANNPNDGPLLLNIAVARGTTMAAGGITFAEETSGPAQWVTLADAGLVEVPAHTNLNLPFEVEVPPDTPPGEYVVGFLAALENSTTTTPTPAPTEGPTDDGFEVIVIPQVAVAVVITVPEANHCAAAISSLSSAPNKGRWELGIKMQNTGNMHFKGSGDVIARPAGGGEPLVQAPFEVGYFIPGDTIEYPLALGPYPSAGEYEIEVNLLTDCDFATTFTQSVGVDPYAISLSASPETGGIVDGEGLYHQGTGITVTATANAGYNFINWTEDGIEVSTSASYPFTVTANRSLVANFTSVITPVAEIGLVKTVGVLADTCASTTALAVLPGETVYYCYTMTNTGNVTLTNHVLVDDLLGTILTGTVSPLASGQSLSTLQLGETITTEVVITTTNVATWTASTQQPDLSATAIATATVGLGEPGIELHIADRFTPPLGSGGPLGGQMSYTVTVLNSGTATLKNVKVIFAVPQRTTFITDTPLLQSATISPTSGPTWDCSNGAPAPTICTSTIAVLSPSEIVSITVALQIVENFGTKALTIEFRATADGTPLTPPPSVDLVATVPVGADDHFSIYLPMMRSSISSLPFQADPD